MLIQLLCKNHFIMVQGGRPNITLNTRGRGIWARRPLYVVAKNKPNKSIQNKKKILISFFLSHPFVEKLHDQLYKYTLI